MMNKSKDSKIFTVPSPADPTWRRFGWALAAVWAGSQSQMAADLGVSQALISRVTRGLQQPGPRLLKALSKQPTLNSVWALTGTGEPYANPSARIATLPISNRPLPGLPSRHRGLLTGEQLAVSTAESSDSRYFLRADARYVQPLVIERGDLLLFETDARIWRRDPHFLSGKPCLVRTTDGMGMSLAQVESVNRASRVSFSRFATLADSNSESDQQAKQAIAAFGKNLRYMNLDDMAPSSTTKSSAKASRSQGTVVAVALELRRLF